MAGLLDYLKVSEGYVGDYTADPSKKAQQKNIGFGVRATEEVRELRELFIANGVEPEVVDDMLLRKSMQDHAARARDKFNKGIRRHHTTGGPTQIPFDKQPPVVQELLTELEFNGGLGGWPELMKHAKRGDYKGVEKEMYLNVEHAEKKGLGEGTKRRNRLRGEYLAEDIKALPKLRLADAYGTVELDEEHSLWPDPSDFGFPKHPIDYLFGSKEPSPQQQYEAARMNRPPLTQPQIAVPDKSMMYPQPKPQMPPIDKSMMYPEPKRSLQQIAQTAQVQPALNPFPWLKGTSGGYYGSGNPRNF